MRRSVGKGVGRNGVSEYFFRHRDDAALSEIAVDTCRRRSSGVVVIYVGEDCYQFQLLQFFLCCGLKHRITVGAVDVEVFRCGLIVEIKHGGFYDAQLVFYSLVDKLKFCPRQVDCGKLRRTGYLNEVYVLRNRYFRRVVAVYVNGNVVESVGKQHLVYRTVKVQPQIGRSVFFRYKS